MLKFVCDFLVTESPLRSCDVMLVLAGRPERKSYGLKLYQQGVARHLLLSVSRFDVRQTAPLLPEGQELIELRNQTPPHERHFWVEIENGRTMISRASFKGTGTYAELRALAALLAPRSPLSIGLISTSIHLRRIRFCCSQIPFFCQRKLYLWAVPDALSGFQRSAWWKRPADWVYLISEYAKLVGYHLMYSG
jgi:hypothetical protein